MSAVVLENVPKTFTKRYWNKVDFNSIYLFDMLEAFWVWWDWAEWKTKDWEVIETEKEYQVRLKAMEDYKNWETLTIPYGTSFEEFENLIHSHATKYDV